MRNILMIATAAAALTACSKPATSTTTVTTNTATGETTTTTTGTPVTAAALNIQPGKWETTITVVDQKVEGAPAGMPVPPKLSPTTFTACVTPEQAKENPAESLRKTKANCTVTNSVYAGGQIASAASCKMPNGAIDMKTAGTYTSTSLDTVSDQSMTMGPMHITTKTKMSARRVGECGQ